MQTSQINQVFDLGNNRFALGRPGRRAINVVERVLAAGAGGRGRPSYRPVRGRRPRIDKTAESIQASNLLYTSLGGRFA